MDGKPDSKQLHSVMERVSGEAVIEHGFDIVSALI
jgi:hypothetical protein